MNQNDPSCTTRRRRLKCASQLRPTQFSAENREVCSASRTLLGYNSTMLRTAASTILLLCSAASAQIVAPNRNAPAPNINLPQQNNAGVTEADGDRLYAERKFILALQAYAAVLSRKESPGVCVKLGDTFNQISADDVSNLYKARDSWDRAVKLDRNFVPARRRLLDLWLEMADLSPGTRGQYLVRARDEAEAILRVDPNDPRALFALQLIVAELYIAGSSADSARVEEAIAALQQLQTAQPDNADIPFTIARAQSRLAIDAAKLGDTAGAEQLAKDAVAVMEAAVAKNRSPALLWRQAQILANIAARGATMNEADASRDARARSLAQVALLATTAFDLAKPDDIEYVGMAQFAAAMHQRAGNVDSAEQVYKKALEKRPSEPVMILQLVDLIRSDPSRQDEVIKLTEAAAAPPKLQPGLRGMLAKESQQRAAVGLVDLRLEKYYAAKEKNEAAAEAMIPAIETDLNKLFQQQGASPNLMRLRGKLQLFRGNVDAAIETLNRGLARVTDSNDRLRYDIMYLLGRAYQRQNKAAEAEKMYAQIIDRIDFAPARIELARLLIGREAYPAARPHIEALAKTNGDNPEVIQMQMVMLQWEGRGDSDALDALLDKMPEDDAAMKVQKVRVAIAARRAAIALRVILPLYEQYRDDSRLVQLVAAAYEVDGKKAEALTALKEYDARRPNIDAVKKMIARLEK